MGWGSWSPWLQNDTHVYNYVPVLWTKRVRSDMKMIIDETGMCTVLIKKTSMEAHNIIWCRPRSYNCPHWLTGGTFYGLPQPTSEQLSTHKSTTGCQRYLWHAANCLPTTQHHPHLTSFCKQIHTLLLLRT